MLPPKGRVRRSRVQGGKRRAGVATVDFETYHDDEYSLRKLSTSEYVRNPQFEAICAAIKLDDGPTEVTFGHKAVAKALKAIDWSETEMLAHHAHFEGLILSHHFGIVPKKYRDTLSMGRGAHAKFERNSLEALAMKYGLQNKLTMPPFKGKHEKDLTPEEREDIRAYNCRDDDVAWELYKRLLPQVPAHEMELIHLTVKMFAAPSLVLDVDLAKSELARETKERAEAIAASGCTALMEESGTTPPKPKKKGMPVTEEHILGSNKVFPELLRHLDIDPPMKPKKGKFAKPGEETYALSKSDEEFTDLVYHPNPKVVALVRGRLAAKSTIGETRAARLLRSGSDGKRLPIYLNYCGAHTTRWSGGDKLNYQNFKKAGQLRQAVMAPPGYQIVDIDSSTIEVRVLAWLADELWLLEAFRQGLDPYIIFGNEVYGRDIAPLGKKSQERFVSKTCVLGLGFQMGGPKLQLSILAKSIDQGMDPVRLELPVCYGLVSRFRGKNKQIVGLWDYMHNEVIPTLAGGKTLEKKGITFSKEKIQLAGHLALHYPEARVKWTQGGKSAWSRRATKAKVDEGSYRTPNGRTKLYGGFLTENVVQYLARHVVAEQMLAISERYQIVMMTHDAVGFLARTEEAPDALAWGLEVMKTPPVWAPDLPVAAEGHFAPVYK